MKKCVFVVIRQQSTEGQRSPQLKLKQLLAIPSQLLIPAEDIALHFNGFLMFVRSRGTFIAQKLLFYCVGGLIMDISVMLQYHLYLM